MVFALTAAAAACGGGGAAEPDAAPGEEPDASTTPDASTALPLDEVDDAYIEAYCDYAVRCGEIVDRALCERVFGAELGNEFVQFEANVADGTIVYDPAAAATCLAAIDGWSCDRTDEDTRRGDEACAEVFTGTVALGGDCFVDEQCADHGSCAPIKCFDACCLSECVAGTPTVDIGDSCFDANCPSDAFCDDTDTCAALLPQGSTCSYDGMCDFGLGCAGGTCEVLPGTGEACPDFECAMSGDECVDGECTARAGDGEACTDIDCMFGLVCPQGPSPTCTPYPSLGESCADTGFCRTGYCNADSLECEALLDNGEACGSGLDCASGKCDDTLEPAECAEPLACT